MKPVKKMKTLKWIKHIVQEEAKYHVLSYDTKGVYCSEPNCEINCPNRLREIIQAITKD